jgi:hypothetical protein
MLVVVSSKSPIMDIANSIKCGLRFAFADTTDVGVLADRIASEWFMGGGMREIVQADPSAFLPYTAEGMTRKLADCLDAAVEGRRMKP